MARVRRIDLGSLAAPVRRNDGTLLVEARLTRTGVFTYRNADGTERREYRPPSQVFDEQSLASFRGRPVTNNHPPEMINSSNAMQYTVGCILETPRKDGHTMVAPLSILDRSTIDEMNAGKLQVSNGYDCDLEMTPGVSPEGEHYDAVQTNIIGNHVAIVSNARAGRDAAVRMDAAYNDDFDRARTTSIAPQTTNRMDTVMDLTQALAALAEANKKIGELGARADKSDKDLELATKRADKLEGERDDLKSKFDKAEAARKDAVDAQGALVSARVELLHSATRILGSKREDGADPIKMSDRDLKLAVIEHVTGSKCDVDSAGKKRSDEYVNARYDAAVEQASDSTDTFREAHDVIERGRNDASDDKARSDADKAYDEMVNANRNAWRNDSDTAKSTK